MFDAATPGGRISGMPQSHNMPTITKACIYEIMGASYFAERLHGQSSKSIRYEKEQSFQVM